MSGGWYDCEPEETALVAVGNYIASMPLTDQEQQLTGERDRARDFAQRVEEENARLLEQVASATAHAAIVEQELAAANRLIANALTWLDRADSKAYFTLGMANILDALTGKTDIDASCGGRGPLTEQEVRDVLAKDRTHYWPGGDS